MNHIEPEHVRYLKAVVDAHGAEGQLSVLQEECGELVAAVSQFRRSRIDADALASEVADVLVMCEQAVYVLGAERVRAAIRAKIEKLKAGLGPLA